jgi:anti-sigma regulatory factor (Ser/Thr protein kinase)
MTRGGIIDSRPRTGTQKLWAFPAEPSSPGRARHRLDLLLVEWGLSPDDRWPVLLVMSELVSNAVEHARSALLLVVTRTDGELWIEVHDGSSAPPRLRAPGNSSRRGHGLRVVQDLAARWSWTARSDGKVVWATFNLPGVDGADGTRPA